MKKRSGEFFLFFVRESKKKKTMEENYFVFKVDDDKKNLKKRQLKSLNFNISCNGFLFESLVKLI